MTPSRDISRLLEIMAALRTPVTGCPWDLKQDFASIAPYTIEEAYEVADAIARGDLDDLCYELGDLLLQVVFHARMAQEQGAFDFGDVVNAVTTKMVRRHPHVFGDARGRDVAAVNAAWEAIKAEEKAERVERRRRHGLPPEPEQGRTLDGVPAGAPALTRAVKLQNKAAKVGFDWPHVRLVLDKIREEIAEVEAEIDSGDREAAAGEVGDLLFALANLARHLDVDPEAALRGTNEKFVRRFAHIEDTLAENGRRPADASLDEMEALWQAAKTVAPKE
ncbi:MazG family protein [Ancylobacter novellus DSM 506]|uniref:Nucleoside triphosphate pyrophosphohydrolase n=1 Tax=Ancylobacter novellus (strain ATCC 8093 / DSM 506 / JCM 20403 / CCM 1077 / IAM 12100 / NBRC 12443 / NCIMB 10456) TaxID=639283 RepID=D6ZYG7_ANCN5|nr:nucleoside triphosphate pyrophosphohydrolase [Ancylobacter novellus]ADH89079.1 MazG family protein [Ancylobacter novellus DSM 506]